MLAVLHGLNKFNHFTYAQHAHVLTDHKPLLSIDKKDIINAPPRQARLLLRVHKFNLTLHFRLGKQMNLSDVLSQSGHELNADSENTGLRFDYTYSHKK